MLITAKTCKSVLTLQRKSVYPPMWEQSHIGLDMPKIMKLVDVARHLGVSVRSLYNMLDDGRFPVPPIPNTKPRRWARADVDAWCDSTGYRFDNASGAVD